MSKTPKPIIIVVCGSKTCNVWCTDPCIDCPIPNKLADIISNNGKEDN